jgi:peptidoglycan hydrolase-like amidase
MCQVGAMGWAECGKTFSEILMHYYRGARVRRLY